MVYYYVCIAKSPFTKLPFVNSRAKGARDGVPSRTDFGDPWVFITGGCNGTGVQWMGVVLCYKLVDNII